MPPTWSQLGAAAGTRFRKGVDRGARRWAGQLLQGADPSAPGGARRVAGEVTAGLIASVVTLAQCLSLSALVFAGPLAIGLPQALWSFLAGAAMACILVALTTTLPPAIAGPRNPPLAVMSVLAATLAAQVLAAGGDAATAVRHVLVALSLATLLAGVVMWLIGRLALGEAVRFVPFPVIGGFLAASGWLLLAGGIRVALGHEWSFAGLVAGVGGAELARLAALAAFVAAVTVLRRLVGGPGVLPAVFIGGALALDIGLQITGTGEGWYLTGAGSAQAWMPITPAGLAGIDWRLVARVWVETASVIGVALISLLLDVSTLEAQRARIADMDAEFRVNGLANIVVAPFGGAVMGTAPNASRLLDQLGARTRAAGLTAGLALAFVVLSGVELTAVVPTPILGGLLVLLGLGVLTDALLPAPAQRSRLDTVLAIAIAAVIVQLGYLTGVVLGLMGACMTFAFRYSRISAIRRHATRAAVAAPVERAREEAALLAREGGRIHVFWLAGYVFFGTSNRMFEDVRGMVGPGQAGGSRWVVLDLGAMTGLDATALLSFTKLVNWARAHHVVLAFAATPAWLERRLTLAGMGPQAGIGVFATRSEALEWCEQGLIGEAMPPETRDAEEVFEAWIGRELGLIEGRRLIETYLSRRELAAGDAVCRQGEPADSIDLVASGSVAILLADETGRSLRVRRMMGRTVVGEMGFLRRTPRLATVAAQDPAVVYTLTREAYVAMLAADAALAMAFLEFIGRILAERVEFTTREIVVLS